MKETTELFVRKLGELFRIRRYALGWSQCKLQSICKTDSCRIENGKTDPALSRVITLSSGLEISIGWLLVLLEMVESGVLNEKELVEVVENWDSYKKNFVSAEYSILKGIAEKQRKVSEAG